jgi:superfamily II DNA or RNA helicase
MDANDPRVIETLKTLIAPGGQIRVSPYVESVQFHLLFGQTPTETKRFESAKRILDANNGKIQVLAKVWSDFEGGSKVFRPELYNTNFLDAYLAYYLTVNVGKLQLLFLELAEKSLFLPRLDVLDVGVASGTSFLAMLDFLLAWEDSCDLHGADLPIQSIRLTGVDARGDCLDYARSTAESFSAQLNRSGRASALISDAVAGARWLQSNLADGPLEVPDAPTLLILSNILSEGGMEPDGHRHVSETIRRLPMHSIALLLEPGDKTRSVNLNNWRRRLRTADTDLRVVAPCDAEDDATPPQHCTTCWNARRESLHRPQLYQRFCEAAERVGGRPYSKWHREYENELLSWSYLLFAKPERPSSLPAPISPGTLVTRFIGRYWGGGDKPYAPATLHDQIDPALEKIKFCPASCEGYKALTLYREPGFILPPLQFGQRVRIIGVAENQSEFRTERRISARAVEPIKADTPSLFIGDYQSDSVQGIDRIAHRLFGFTGMREFQHRILERVLAGRSIFAIAATGGGKSECYILPAMLLPGLTIVVSPLKSLMQDQYDQRLRARYGLGSVATYINSSLGYRERENRVRQMELGYYKLVYLTPEQCTQSRMLDSLRRADERVGLRYLALDEAHCISHWGHDFRPAYLNILSRFRDAGLNPVRIALTATASPRVREDICKELELDPRPLEQGGDLLVYSANRPELNLIVKVASSVSEKVQDIEYRLGRLLRENRANADPGAAIVFMPYTGPGEISARGYDGKENDFSRSRKVTQFASHLERALRTRVGIYHGKMEDDDDEDVGKEAAEAAPGEIHNRSRRREQERFIDGEVDVMVATKGFGMGIDKPNIRQVLHHTTPSNLEAYTQEAGRAGRDGQLADVVLYFSHQSADDGSGAGRSDGEVQRFFLNQKYIRELDVRALWSFLTQRCSTPGVMHGPARDRLYITADEVMGHFNAMVAQGQYQWPEIPPRESKGKEYGHHRVLLDRGHDYQEKSKYIYRIISVCYEIAPTIGGRRLELIRGVVSVGTELKKAKVKDAEAIIRSNDSFAVLLCEAGLNAHSLCGLLAGDRCLLTVAARLSLTLEETATLLQDIKKADGRWIGGAGWRQWEPSLLDFRGIFPPRRGPAAGKMSLQAWRDYAGATRRATKSEAAKRARIAGRDTPIDDDWFGWKELPQTSGWEVLPGELLRLPQLFESFLKEFLTIHEVRRAEDDSAYQLLLRDYIGVTEDGKRVEQTAGCLRVVMLGYLKTDETVVGGNCGGCSVCCPAEEFETDLTNRAARIVRFSQALAQQLADFERLVSVAPEPEALEEFWKRVMEEEAAARKLTGYLLGWTNRLISETPGHVTAYWIRADGALRGHLPLREPDLLRDVERVFDELGEVDGLNAFEDLLDTCRSRLDTPPPRLHRLRAKLMARMQRPEEERDAWHALLAGEADNALALDALRALARLFAPRAPLEDTAAHQEALKQALELAPEQGRATVTPYLASLAPKALQALVADQEPDLIRSLLEDWFECRRDEHPTRLLSLWLSLLRKKPPAPHERGFVRALEPFILDLTERLPGDRADRASLLCQLETHIAWDEARWRRIAANWLCRSDQPDAAGEYWSALLDCPFGEGAGFRDPDSTLQALGFLLDRHAEKSDEPDGSHCRRLIGIALNDLSERAIPVISRPISRLSLTELCELALEVSVDSQALPFRIWLEHAPLEIGSFLTELAALLPPDGLLGQHKAIGAKVVKELFALLGGPHRDALFTRHSVLDLVSLRGLAEHWLARGTAPFRAVGRNDHDEVLFDLLVSADYAGASVVGVVEDKVKGGYRVDLGGIAAFMPQSHSGRYHNAEASGLPRTTVFKLLDLVQAPKRRVVVSARLAVEARFSDLRTGDVIDGVVSKVADFGVFVDIGGFDGLLHNSLMDRRRSGEKALLPKLGECVRVWVLAIDRERMRVQLGPGPAPGTVYA